MKIFYSARHQKHNTDAVEHEGKPFITEEIPARVEKILEHLRRESLGEILPPTDHGSAPISAVHDQEFIQHLSKIFNEQAEFFGVESPVFPETFPTRPLRYKPTNLFGRKGYYAFGTGSPILKGTWEAAYWSAQCALSAADYLLSSEESVYALCRPPGHHAGRDFYGGFCYLNNVAIAARYIDAKVAILDIDFHHGNGTQEIFYSDPSVLFCSLHAHPDDDYPYFWGSADELGEGEGYGYNHNFPLPLSINDLDYCRALEVPLEIIEKYDPQFLLVSFGADIGVGDPVGGFSITTQGFEEIGKLIKALSISTMIVQEGGYDIENLGEAVTSFLKPFDNSI